MAADILAAIDGALDDWKTSPDAMRWRPEGAEDGTGVFLADWERELADTERRGVFFVAADPAADGGAVVTGFRADDGILTLASITGDAEDLTRAMVSARVWSINDAREALGLPSALITEPVVASVTIPVTLTDEGFCFWGRLAKARWHEPHRCRACNPYGNPPKLRIDGREYARRRAARKRGRR